MLEVTKDILKKIYKKRPLDARKYDFGLLLVIGGSEFYSGSPALSTMAAFRAGVDMVRVIAPRRAADIISSFAPDLAAYPLKGDYLTKEHLSILIEMTEAAKAVSRGKTAVVIGGGMGRSEEVKETILEYLSQVSIPVVVDADAIHALAKNPEIISKKPSLITPHAYEFFVLTGKDVRRSKDVRRPKEIQGLSEEEKIKIVQEEAQRLQTTILLKGKVDIISDGKEVALNKTGSPCLTTGGCGDTLAGICGALMARGIDPFTTGQAGAFINGLAGELATKKLGESLMATNLIDEIPNVLLKS